MKISPEQQIIMSWQLNVKPWVAAIAKGEIESRVLVTNTAIVDTINACKPKILLDVGCGEGWLVRELAANGIDALGVDVIPAFIEIAGKHGLGRFREMSYEQTSFTALQETFDLVACNFSLLGENSVHHLFQHIPSLLNPKGRLVVQTLHPITGCGAAAYKDGWREGSWAGFNSDFCAPAPWYFRTFETWKALFAHNGFTIVNTIEPRVLDSSQPLSIIFDAELI